MLRQLVYCSSAQSNITAEKLERITEDSLPFNHQNNITGILLFDGDYFFQVIEGESDTILWLFDHLHNDDRHTNIVKIADMAIKERDFGHWHLRTIYLDPSDDCYWLPPDLMIRRDSRVFGLLNGFATGRWRSGLSGVDPKVTNTHIVTCEQTLVAQANFDYQFAFQPIVDSKRQVISSYEALLRDNTNRYPDQILNAMPPTERYEFDLESKALAIAQGAQLLTAEQSLSVNLSPGALVHHPDVACTLLSQLQRHNMKPHQLILEITESELIEENDSFFSAIEKIRSTGIKVAMDDFGAGYAGLSLLADFLPDKIKIDRSITSGIHTNGPRQAILSAVLEFSNSMGIPLIVEGVELLDEWLWLQNTGIQKFQGFLFAKPKLNGVHAINFEVSKLSKTHAHLTPF